jgi:hypothetical protein
VCLMPGRRIKVLFDFVCLILKIYKGFFDFVCFFWIYKGVFDSLP